MHVVYRPRKTAAKVGGAAEHMCEIAGNGHETRPAHRGTGVQRIPTCEQEDKQMRMRVSKIQRIDECK